MRDLSLSANRTGTVEIVTPGIAQIEGELVLADAGAGNGIDFIATERLQIVTPTGAVRVRDGSGMTAGFLNLTSNNIWSASAAILERLAADPNFDGRDFALTLNDGPFNPRGSIEAGDVTLSVRDTLFVQNSGGVVDFAGITVRESTLTIVPTGAQPLVAFAFGRQINRRRLRRKEARAASTDRTPDTAPESDELDLTQPAQFVGLKNLPAITVNVLLNFSTIVVALLGLGMSLARRGALAIASIAICLFTSVALALVAVVLATRVEAGLGAHVTILDRSLNRLKELDELYGDRLTTIYSTFDAIEERLPLADLVIGAVLIPGAAAPKLVQQKAG